MARRYDSRARRWRTVEVIERQALQTDEGFLNFTVRPIPDGRPGRTRAAFLNGHMISDDELELRLAATTNRE